MTKFEIETLRTLSDIRGLLLEMVIEATRDQYDCAYSPGQITDLVRRRDITWSLEEGDE